MLHDLCQSRNSTVMDPSSHHPHFQHASSAHRSPPQHHGTDLNSSTEIRASWLSTSRVNNNPAVVYIYTLPNDCKSFPEYLTFSLLQAVLSQPTLDVIFASNFEDCRFTYDGVKSIPNLKLVDTNVIITEKTNSFSNISFDLFKSGNLNNTLWRTSALRFFQLEDIMKVYNYKEIIHVEADNLLYRDLSTALPTFRQTYSLAVTPLLANKSMFTASIFWISQINFLKEFTNYLLDIAFNRNNLWKNYLGYLRRYFCCKKGGPDADSKGNGVKPFSINEMTMLSYYYQLNSEVMGLLPVVPYYPSYHQRRPFCDPKVFMPGGKDVGGENSLPFKDLGIWDSGSWGQNIGGTWKKRGRDVGFTDNAHIVGQTFIMADCSVKMLCTNGKDVIKELLPESAEESSPATKNFTVSIYETCFTAPFVRCNQTYAWSPLWNLHVHSKNTQKFASQPCNC
jgi:hypothetical protein